MIDFFNRRKLDELDAENESLKIDVEALRRENERLTAKLRGDRVCDGCCSVCKHGVLVPVYSPMYGPVASYVCALECKCKDFKQRVDQ